MKQGILLLTMMLAGCSTWPDEGKGGWAEKYNQATQEIELDWYHQQPEQLRNEYDHVVLKLDLLKSRGIKACMPAKLYNAELMLNRIKRELTAYMYEDAESDLLVFYHQLNQLDNHFERLNRETQCGVAKQDHSSVEPVLKRVEELLNSDNQFAVDSFEITPKYMTRIAQAAELMKLTTQSQILLVGHTDKRGTEKTNFELAYKRAEQVKHWLALYGVKSEQLITIAQGSHSPYQKTLKQNKAVMHSNRRVNAYILANDMAQPYDGVSQVKPLTEWTEALDKQEKKQ